MLFFPSGIFYSRNSIQNVHTASRPKLQSAFTQTHNPHNLTHTKMHVASSDEESNLPMEAMTIASSDEEHMITRSAFGDRYMRVASSDDESDLSRLVSTSVDIRRSGFKLVHVLSNVWQGPTVVRCCCNFVSAYFILASVAPGGPPWRPRNAGG